MNILNFSIGPVQGFIARARKTRDFWAGSFLLSYLAGQAMAVREEEAVTLPAWKEYCTVGAFAVSVVGMMLMNQLGNIAYVVQPLDAGRTRVSVNLGFSLQGPLAQFSRSGLVKDFVARLIQEFGKNVARRMDPARSADAALPPARLNAFSMGVGVLWARIRRWFGRGDQGE